MPKRLEIFHKGGFFHIFNKSIDHKTIFSSKAYISLFKKTLLYYRAAELRYKFSRFRKKNKQGLDEELQNNLLQPQQSFTCFAFAFMPNHFHLLLRQENETRLSDVMRRVLISFTRTYNLLNNRGGPIFMPQFKAVEVNNEEQFVHVSRYIHLNPYSSGLITDLGELLASSLTSLPNYLNRAEELC